MADHGWGGWRRTITSHGRQGRLRYRWRIPCIRLVRTADRHWIAWNTYPGCLIGVGIGLPRLDRRPGYPVLSILWGRPGRFIAAKGGEQQ